MPKTNTSQPKIVMNTDPRLLPVVGQGVVSKFVEAVIFETAPLGRALYDVVLEAFGDHDNPQ